MTQSNFLDEFSKAAASSGHFPSERTGQKSSLRVSLAAAKNTADERLMQGWMTGEHCRMAKPLESSSKFLQSKRAMFIIHVLMMFSPPPAVQQWIQRAMMARLRVYTISSTGLACANNIRGLRLPSGQDVWRMHASLPSLPRPLNKWWPGVVM